MFHSPKPPHAETFAWAIPPRYNIGTDVVDRWAARAPDRPAVIEVGQAGPKTTTYAALRDESNRLAAALRRLGIGQGTVVAVFLPQSAKVIAAHAAIYKLGAIVLPLAAVFGADALSHRLGDSGARLVVTNSAGAARLAALSPRPAALETIVSVDGPEGATLGWDNLIERESGGFAAVDTGADDPGLMIYTSGTTGLPKGALHAHRVLPGHLPGVQFSHDGLPCEGDLMWTPADWAWAGGLLNAVLPALQFGVPVVAWRRESFDPDAAVGLLRDLRVRNAFIPPTALRMMRAAMPGSLAGLSLRSLSSAGEALGSETQDWARRALGVEVNDVYGQTECNYVLGSCAALGIHRAGAIGRATPGHRVAVIRPDGTPCEPGERGDIAVARPDPAMFLGYWNQPAATAAKFTGDWMTTGDEAVTDPDGYVSFVGRADDIITSSGFRIGPVEIEDCLLRHPAVAGAAAVGKPDPIRTEIVKAFVVLRDGFAGSAALADDIRAFVRTRLSAHEYPREVDFVPDLPKTPTGKIMRRVLRDRG